MLVVMTCPTNLRGEYVAPDLAEHQTLDNLDKFGSRLERAHEMLRKRGSCTCKA